MPFSTALPHRGPEGPLCPDARGGGGQERLQSAFLKCEKLQRHVRFLYTNGSLYKVYNGNLLYHGCVPLNNDGTFRKVRIFGKEYSGKALYDILEVYARKGLLFHG